MDDSSPSGTPGPSLPLLAPPELVSFITVGYNSTVRNLENASRMSAPTYTQSTVNKSENQDELETRASLVAVFVDRTGQPSIMYSQLPLLVYTASRAVASEPSIRLITLPAGAMARLSAIFGVPRVGILGLARNAPGGGPLLEFLCQEVPEINIPWLKDIKQGFYHPVEIKVVKTTVPRKTTKP